MRRIAWVAMALPLLIGAGQALARDNDRPRMSGPIDIEKVGGPDDHEDTPSVRSLRPSTPPANAPQAKPSVAPSDGNPRSGLPDSGAKAANPPSGGAPGR